MNNDIEKFIEKTNIELDKKYGELFRCSLWAGSISIDVRAVNKIFDYYILFEFLSCGDYDFGFEEIEDNCGRITEEQFNHFMKIRKEYLRIVNEK